MADVIPGDYGIVVVTAGKYKGKVGYYDDDASEKTAIVYFTNPIGAPSYDILFRYLRCATEAEEQVFARKHMSELAYARAAKAVRAR